MATDQGPVVQSAILRGELVRLRKERELTQEQVAGNLEWSPSKLIRVEGGRSAITKTDLDALLNLYSVKSEPQREKLHALNRGAREQAWWDVYREQFAPTYLNYVGYEAGASIIRQFQGSVVPGLLQTREYAAALTLAAVSVDEPDKIGPVVDLRLQRQRELAKRSNPPRQFYVLDEAVIRRHLGIDKDPAIMPNQLLHIVAKAAADDLVTVRVIPFGAGEHAGQTGPFTLLEFDGDLPDILYIDAGKSSIVMVNAGEPQVAAYADDFERLLAKALPPDESLDFIRRAAEEIS